MIQVIESQSAIVVAGHSRYAPPGQDIVCAAVSALVQTLALSLNRLAPGETVCSMEPGSATIRYTSLSEKGRLLVCSFFVGIEAVAAAYPDNVTVTRRGSQ